jgi:glycerophosphoryl diester phosphodiesterase
MTSNCQIVAHRGASFDAPENTLSAFRLAWERGVKVVEGDFRLTSDGRIVCFHDEKTDRIGGGNKVIATSALDDLRRLDTGLWKGDDWAGEKMPALEEVLDEMPDGNTLLLEVKCGVEILPVLADFVLEGRVIVMSFNADVVAGVKEMMPSVEAFWLARYKKKLVGRGYRGELDGMLKVLSETGADGCGAKAHQSIDEEFVGRLHEAGMKVDVWTVDDPAEAKRYIELGVDYLTTNRPEYIKRKT